MAAMYQAYNPIQKHLDEFVTDDLARLRNVAEGWFVDYKRQSISHRDFAKHISAFANQYGGWIFVGVEEDGGSRTASAFPGLEKSEVGDVLLRLREAVSAHLQPTPDFSTKIIYGPDNQIGLDSDRAVIVISVPRGLYPPYIHSSGRVYRRVDDESKPESDRFELDKLWSRGQELEQRFEDHLRREPSLDIETAPRVFVYFFSDPTRRIDREILSFSDFDDVVRHGLSSGEAELPFDNLYSAADGFIARQLAGNDPNSDTLTFRWWHWGGACVEIPIGLYHQHEAMDYLARYDQGPNFLSMLRAKGFHRALIVDLTYSVPILGATAAQFLKLRAIVGDVRKAFMKVKVSNVGGTTPFLDSEQYLEEIHQWGVPVVRDDTIWYPQGFTTNDLVELRTTEAENIFDRTVGLGGGMLLSLGLLRNYRDADAAGKIYAAALKTDYDSRMEAR